MKNQFSITPDDRASEPPFIIQSTRSDSTAPTSARQIKHTVNHSRTVNRGIQTAPVVFLKARPKYVRCQQPWRIPQPSKTLSQPPRRIISKRIHSDGFVTFVLGPAANPPGTLEDLIRVSVEEIIQYIDLKDLEKFEHAMFENEIAEEEAKTRDFRRRESAQLKELKRGRGRPKKIREGALAPANKRDIVSVKDTLNSEETSSDTESENSSLASHEVTYPPIETDSRRKVGFKLEITSNSANDTAKDKVPRSDVDNQNAKVGSVARKISQDPIRKPRGRPKGKSSLLTKRELPRSIHDRGKVSISSGSEHNKISNTGENIKPEDDTERANHGDDKEALSSGSERVSHGNDRKTLSSDSDERVLLLQKFQTAVRPKSSQSNSSARRLPRQGTPSSFPSAADLPKLNTIKSNPPPRPLPQSRNDESSTNSQRRGKFQHTDFSNSDTEDELCSEAYLGSNILGKDKESVKGKGAGEGQESQHSEGSGDEDEAGEGQESQHSEGSGDEDEAGEGQESQHNEVSSDMDEAEDDEKSNDEAITDAEKGDDETTPDAESSNEDEPSKQIRSELSSRDTPPETAEELLARFQTPAGPPQPRRAFHLFGHPSAHNPLRAPSSMTSPYPPSTANGFSTPASPARSDKKRKRTPLSVGPGGESQSSKSR